MIVHTDDRHVLLIDDDSHLRAVMRRGLEIDGFAVVEAASGREALALLRDGTAVQYVVTDLQMPNGSGGWFLAQLGYDFPELLSRTVVISGDADSVKAAHIAVRWRRPVLAKPFSAAELSEALRELAA